MRKILIVTIAVVILLGIAFAPKLFLDNGDRLLWQLESWARIFATLLVAVDVVLLTIYYAKGKHLLKKIIAALGFIVLLVACLIGLFVALLKHDNKVWGDKNYVVYSESYGLFDNYVYVLYKRDGLFDRQMCTLYHVYDATVKKVDYTMYPNANLIKEEADMADFDGFNDYHTTRFFRLSDGHHFHEELNDSLLSVIAKTNK